MKSLFIIVLLISLLACYQDNPNCDCEIVTDQNQKYMTITVTACHFCCWYTTIEACENIDSIAEAFFNYTLEDDPVCEWENASWEWQYGKVL